MSDKHKVAYVETHPPFRKGANTDNIKQICPCSPDCDPKEYEGRDMLFPDEAWHNWYFNMINHPPSERHREECGDCMDSYLHSEAMDQ